MPDIRFIETKEIRMYESPIEKIFGDIQEQINKQDEDNIMMTVNRSIGYEVNKEELLKALRYDRDQYEKGYQDAKAEIVTCKDCKYWRTDEKVRCRLLPYADANDFCSYGERTEE